MYGHTSAANATARCWTEDQPFSQRTVRVNGPFDSDDPATRAEMARQGILGLTPADVLTRFIYGGKSPDDLHMERQIERGVTDAAHAYAKARLSDRAVREMRRRYLLGASMSALAREFHISLTTAQSAIRGERGYARPMVERGS